MARGREFDIAFRLGAELDRNFSKTMEKSQDALNNLQTALKGIGGIALTGIASGLAGIAAGATASFLAAEDFHSSLEQIEAKTGASAEEMAELEESTRDLYNQNLGEDWNDLANAIATVSNVTELSGEALENATADAIAYRDVFEGEITESIKTADTMMKNFGITSEESYNLLAQGAQKGLDKSGELLESANEYAPQFAALGFTAEQMFSTFNAGLESGAFNLDKVGDAVKEFNIRVKDGSDLTEDAFEALNMDAEKMAQTFAAGGPEAQKAFQEVVKAISAVEDPIKRNQIGVALMGTQFEDLEADVVAAMGVAQNEFDKTRKTMEQVKNIKYDSAGQALKGLRRQFVTSILMPVGDRVLPKLQEFSDYIDANMPTIEREVQDAMQTAEVWFNRFGDAIDWVRENSDELIMVSGILLSTFISFKVISTVVTLMTTLRGILGGLTVAQYAWNLAMNLNPIGMLSLAIGGLVGTGIWLYQNWETVSSKFSGIWSDMQSGAINSINWIIGGINSLINAINKIPGIEIPDIPTIEAAAKATTTVDGSHADGLANVPYDGYIAELHKGERVLTAEDNDNIGSFIASSGSNRSFQVSYNPQIIIQGNADKTVIQEAVSQGYDNFKRWMQRYESEKGRLSF